MHVAIEHVWKLFAWPETVSQLNATIGGTKGKRLAIGFAGLLTKTSQATFSTDTLALRL